LPEVENIKLQIFEGKSYSPDSVYTDNETLRLVLRPCLYRLITVEEPRHHVRVASTVDLLRADFTPNQILEIYRSLKWKDWNEEITRYQIEHCKPIVYSKRKLKQLGICFECGRGCI